MNESESERQGPLTYDQVVETGRRAVRLEPIQEAALSGQGAGREWLFEEGDAWLLVRDGLCVRSQRLARSSQVPQDGWRHDGGCDCTYCVLP